MKNSFLTTASLLAASLALSLSVQAQSALQVVAQQPPGSGSDAMTRAWAECASRQIGQPTVVQNKPGANGILAINYLKGLPADGQNVMSIGMSQMTITPYVQFADAPDLAGDGTWNFGVKGNYWVNSQWAVTAGVELDDDENVGFTVGTNFRF
jgi:tripartite-type tricarboxylate transporter receptor subunit TctC